MFIGILGLNLSLEAQDKKKEWDVANPPGNWTYKEVKLSTNEGTWMNLDVSPDGKQIVFDMLGDIYIMPITGGKAKALRSGLPTRFNLDLAPMASKLALQAMLEVEIISGQ